MEATTLRQLLTESDFAVVVLPLYSNVSPSENTHHHRVALCLAPAFAEGAAEVNPTDAIFF
jgi:hypothetical protein